MSTVPPTPAQSTPAASPAASSSLHHLKPQRVLACVLCQQRKVKCDRQFPCARCIKSRAQCVPATLTPARRKRRFPERELLDRLRRYEDLLRQHNINFEALHKDPSSEKDSSNIEGGYESDEDQPEATVVDSVSPSTTDKHERTYVVKDFRHAMHQGFRDAHDDGDSSHGSEPEVVVKRAWDRSFANDDHLLFGFRQTTVDLATLHPEPVQLFRLWQIYLDNVNPLLKVTHTPGLQACILEAASNPSAISTVLEALMFGIYCMAVRSLSANECLAMFGSSKDDLLTKFQYGCQQALINCGFLRTNDRDCLTAFYLYLVSVGTNTDPRALSSMLGLAIRIAQRMGLDSETACAKYDVLEAEMRRRLWYSLILFDTRIGQLIDHNIPSFGDTWNCQIPLNVNDCDLRSEMKKPPTVYDRPAEAIFIVVRSEVEKFIRRTMYRLDGTSTDPILKSDAQNNPQRSISADRELASLESMIENKYLKFCNPENPIHFLTTWMTRGYLAKWRLVETYSRSFSQSARQAEAQRRDTALSQALTMLECDTRIMTSPLTKGYLWLIYLYFPLPAYIHIVQDLRRRPLAEQVEHAWKAMSDNYEVRFAFSNFIDDPFFNMFSKIIFQAWEAREEAFKQTREPLVPPKIVSHLRAKLAGNAQNLQDPDQENPSYGPRMGVDDFPMPLPTDWASHNLLYRMGGHGNNTGTRPGVDMNIFGPASFDFDVNQVDWAMMDWGMGNP